MKDERVSLYRSSWLSSCCSAKTIEVILVVGLDHYIHNGTEHIGYI